MTTTINHLLPLGGIKKESLAQAAEVFAQPNTWQPIRFANMKAINKAPDFGFWLDKKSLSTAGWHGLPHNGIEKTIKFGKQNTPEEGILFHKPNMIIIDQSPRFVEVTNEGELACKAAQKAKEAGQPYEQSFLRLEKANAFIDIYCDQTGSTIDENGFPYGGSILYDELRSIPDASRYISMRTLYLVFLLDDKYEMLHSTPVVLSLRGLAAVEFSGAVTQFGKAVLGEIAASDTQYSKLSNAKASVRGLRNFYFTVELEGGTGGANNNWITKVKELDGGFLAIGGDYITDEDVRRKVLDCAEVNDGFAYRFAKQASADYGWHEMSGAVEQALLPSAKLENITTATEVLF